MAEIVDSKRMVMQDGSVKREQTIRLIKGDMFTFRSAVKMKCVKIENHGPGEMSFSFDIEPTSKMFTPENIWRLVAGERFVSTCIFNKVAVKSANMKCSVKISASTRPEEFAAYA